MLVTASGTEAVALVQSAQPDLVLLDLLLPDIDGFAACERIRQFSNVPIIIITGRKTEHYKVRGLGLGADDYLIKPFSNKELVARMRAALRRMPVSAEAEPPACMRFNDFEIDALRPEVKTAQRSIRLTRTEHKLLYYLASNAGQTLTHRQILDKVWGYDCDDQTQLLWVNISRLRKKIEPNPMQPRYILTEPGVGYCFMGTNKLN